MSEEQKSKNQKAADLLNQWLSDPNDYSKDYELLQKTLKENPLRFMTEPEKPIDLEKAHRIAKELRWKDLSKEQPRPNEIVLVKLYDEPDFLRYKPYLSIFEEVEGDYTGLKLSYNFKQVNKWLPLSALKVLDE